MHYEKDRNEDIYFCAAGHSAGIVGELQGRLRLPHALKMRLDCFMATPFCSQKLLAP